MLRSIIFVLHLRKVAIFFEQVHVSLTKHVEFVTKLYTERENKGLWLFTEALSQREANILQEADEHLRLIMKL